MSRDEDRIDRLIQSVLNVDPVPGFESRIVERVRSEARVRRVLMRRLAAGAGLASAVALVVLMIGFPQRESQSAAPEFASERIAKPAEVSASVNNAPSSSQPLPVLSPVGIAVGDPLATAASSALPAEALSPASLKDFSLPDPNLRQFEIPAFSLLASNEGAAE
jgi:hypothetical protein